MNRRCRQSYEIPVVAWYADKRNDRDDSPRTFTKRKPAKAKHGKKGTPRSKARSKNNVGSPSQTLVRRPPPLLADYGWNSGDNVREQERRWLDDSIDATCVHYDTCAGCTVGRNVANTDVVQAAQRYFADERYDGTSTTVSDDLDSYPVILPSPATAWRTQAKLAVANKSSSAWTNNGCVFGLFQKGTHRLQAIPNCVVHHPSINQAVTVLEQATAKAGTSAYSEEARDGDLRYVQLQVERVTGKVCLTLVWNAATLKECQPSLARLVKELNHNNNKPDDSKSNNVLWHSIWCHCNDGLKNNIFSRSPGRWHRLSGPEFLREPLPVAATSDTSTTPPTAAGWLYFTPLTFRQGNLDGFDILALDVARAVPAGSKVCELYGGVGVLGLTSLAHHHHHHHHHKNALQWLRCSDENPANARCFQRAVESLPTEMTGRTNEWQQKVSRRDYSGNNERSYNKGDNDEEGMEDMTVAERAAMMGSGRQQPFGRLRKAENTKKTSYMIASAAKALKSGQALGANLLIVDPPRKGLETEVLEELCKPQNPDQPYVESATFLTIPDERVNWVNDVQTLIYVSCGFDALASDCDRLLSSRGAKWRLQSSTGFILFPGSDHVETLAIFQRN